MVLVDISVIKVYINKMTKEELKNFVLTHGQSGMLKKRKIAKENNLNYLEIYSTNLSECINVINTYINEHFNNE